MIRQFGCNVLPLDEGLRRLYAGKLPPRSVALTVDDGTFDFYKRGFPIFESFGFPVTVYFTTYYAQFNRPVFDIMQSYLLWRGRGRALCWPEVLGTGDPLVLSGRGLQVAGRRLRAYPVEQGLSGLQKDELLSQLADRLAIDYQDICRRRLLHVMTMEEARDLTARGVDFQLHTHRHGVSLDKERFAGEISENRKALWLLRRDGRTVHFCYPGGVHRPEFLPWLAEWDVASATTCQPGIASRRTPALLLPRLLDTSTVSEDEFVAWLSGVAAFFPRRRYPETEGQFLERRGL